MPEDLVASINRLYAECADLDNRIEKIKNDFIDETVRFTNSWCLKQIDAQVVRNADVTIKLGAEKLCALNSEVSSFQKKLPGIVEKRLNKDNLWWHKKQIGQTYCYFDQRPLLLSGYWHSRNHWKAFFDSQEI